MGCAEVKAIADWDRSMQGKAETTRIIPTDIFNDNLGLWRVQTTVPWAQTVEVPGTR